MGAPRKGEKETEHAQTARSGQVELRDGALWEGKHWQYLTGEDGLAAGVGALQIQRKCHSSGV